MSAGRADGRNYNCVWGHMKALYHVLLQICVSHFPPGQDFVLKCRLAVLWILPGAKTAVKLVLFVFFPVPL